MANDNSGQLALLDAMLFFAIALVICSVQLTSLVQLEEREAQLTGPMSRSDPGTLLRVLLKASIGTEVSIPIDGGLAVPAHTPISECLAAEAAALVKGMDKAAFTDLNQLVLGIATNLSHPLLNAHMVLTHGTGEDVITLIRIEQGPPAPGDVAAANSELSDCASGTVVVALLLQPAFLPEGFGV